MVELKAGSRWRSATGTTEVVVVKGPGRTVSLECGGRAMVPHDADVAPEFSTGGLGEPVLIGKRYTDEDGAVELLCTKPGDGPLAIGGITLVVKGAKPLPSSD
jgi:hypothetical protein